MRSLWKRVIHDKGGFLQFLPAAFAAGKTIYDLSKGKDKGPNLPPPPEYFTDPDYRKTQSYLSDLGINVLDGKIPDYYKGIGQSGGQEFENYLGMLEGDVQRGALETAAATGRGGGAATEIATRETGRLSTEARYKDYARAMEDKKWLFNEGRGITEGVRNTGQQEGANRNTFNLKSYGLNVGNILTSYGIDKQNEAEFGNLIGQDIGGIFGAYGGGKSTGTFAGGVGGMMGNYDWTDIFNKIQTPKTANVNKNITDLTGKALGGISFA